jgi:thiol-disulfide isomerase/thioredoxin
LQCVFSSDRRDSGEDFEDEDAFDARTIVYNPASSAGNGAAGAGVDGGAEGGGDGVSDDGDGDGDGDSDGGNASDGDDSLAAIRARRLAQLKEARLKDLQRRQLGHGELTLVDETEFLPAVTGSRLVVCHFFSDEFFRCSVMDARLKDVARKHFGTRFIRINAPKAPFFVARLAVRMLPTVIMFIDGKVVDRLTGFEDLVPEGRAADDFTVAALENRVSFSGVIKAPSAGGNVVVAKKGAVRRGTAGRGMLRDPDDSDDSYEN